MTLVVPKLLHEVTSRNQWGKVILERKFELPSGKTADFFVWGGTVVPSIIFPVTPRGKVVALRHFRYAANEVVIELPGGCPYEGETAEEIARKELEEETGFTAERFVKLGPPLWFEPASCITPYTPILAVGCTRTGDPHLDETEIAEPVVYPIAEWITMISRGEIRDSKSIAITFLALPHVGYEVRAIPQ